MKLRNVVIGAIGGFCILTISANMLETYYEHRDHDIMVTEAPSPYPVREYLPNIVYFNEDGHHQPFLHNATPPPTAPPTPPPTAKPKKRQTTKIPHHPTPPRAIPSDLPQAEPFFVKNP